MEKLKNAWSEGIAGYTDFSGLAKRANYWWWVVTVFIILFCTNLIDGFLINPLLGLEGFGPESGQPLSWFVSLGLLLPNLAFGARRLHDVGKSGWFLLLSVIPILGTLILLYFLIQPSKLEDNQFRNAA